MILRIVWLGLAMVFALPTSAATLRSFGAKGDGVSDDTAALVAAFRQADGAPLDGEGLTYVINGSVRVNGSLRLRRANFRQVMRPIDTTPYLRSATNTNPPQVTPPEALVRMVGGVPLLHHSGKAVYAEDPVVTGDAHQAILQVLNQRMIFVTGTAEKPATVELEDVKIDRGDHPEGGMASNAAGLFLVQASPVTLRRVEVSGAGKGSGMFLIQCRKVRLEEVYLHDLRWAPHRGDVTFSAAVLKRDFGWNNAPIYEYDERKGRFHRVRVQEQLTGMTLAQSADVEIVRSRIERVGATIDGKFLPWQADGLTVSGVTNFVMRDCVISHAWEGIDFTGRGVNGFVQENIRISDCFAYSFKYAHPQWNGKVINCISERASYRAFTIGSECENIEFIGCVALETGSGGYWAREGRERNGIAGFVVDFDSQTSPKRITLRDCRAENLEFKTMEHGFSTSDRARNPEHQIRLINPKVTGATLRPVDGFAVE